MSRSFVFWFVAVGLSSCAAATVKQEPAPLPASSNAAEAPSQDDEGFRRVRPEPRPTSEIPYPIAEHAALKNGLRLYFVRRPGGVVTFSLVCRGGAEVVPQGKSGLAAFTVRLMTEGTRSRSSLELAKGVEDLGTSLEQDAGRDFTRLGMSTLKEDFEKGMALLADVVQKPAFLPAEVERVRSEWLDKLERERQEPHRLASLAGFRLLYGPVWGAPVTGSPKDVSHLRRTDLLGYHRAHVTPDRCALTTAGDAEFETLRTVATAHFGSWSKTASRAPESPPLPPVESMRIYLVDRPGSVQTALFLGRPFPPRSAPGFEARDLVNNVVGGLFTSRLNQNLRETHAYTYGARSTVFATQNLGGFVVMTSVRTDATAEALEEALAEIHAVGSGKRPLTSDEIERSRADLIRQTGSHLEQTATVEADLRDLFRLGLPTDYFHAYPGKLRSVTREELSREEARLAGEDTVVVMVGDKAKIAGPLERAGFTVVPAVQALIE